MSNMGNIQASGYIARYFGSAVGAVGGAVLYNKDSWWVDQFYTQRVCCESFLSRRLQH